MPLEAPTAKFQFFRPNRSQEKLVHDGLGLLQLTAPFWSSLLYSKLPLRYTYDIDRLATDGSYCYVNPDALAAAKWSIPNVAFGLAHEVAHYIRRDLILAAIWRDAGVAPCPHGPLPYDHGLMGRAKDYVINAMLIDGKVGEFPSEGLFDPRLSAKGMESCLQVYETLWQRQKQQPQGGGAGADPDHGGFDQHLQPSPQAIEAEERGGAVQRAQAIASARMVAEAAGKGELPAALKSLIGEIMEPKVKWQDQLKSSMHRAAGIPAHDWSRVNKRLISRPDPWGRIVFARKTEYGCGTVVVGYDTSGSCIGPDVQQRFFSEMAGIVADLNPERLIVVWCDAEVQRVDDMLEPTDLEELRLEINDLGGAPGGGGTSFVPVFDWVRDEGIEPDMLVYLTDTYGVFPDEPEYPVIWCSLVKARVPFGELIEVDKLD
jgi:predicted metal-dependent peptidase